MPRSGQTLAGTSPRRLQLGAFLFLGLIQRSDHGVQSGVGCRLAALQISDESGVLAGDFAASLFDPGDDVQGTPAPRLRRRLGAALIGSEGALFPCHAGAKGVHYDRATVAGRESAALEIAIEPPRYLRVVAVSDAGADSHYGDDAPERLSLGGQGFRANGLQKERQCETDHLCSPQRTEEVLTWSNHHVSSVCLGTVAQLLKNEESMSAVCTCWPSGRHGKGHYVAANGDADCLGSKAEGVKSPPHAADQRQNGFGRADSPPSTRSRWRLQRSEADSYPQFSFRECRLRRKAPSPLVTGRSEMRQKRAFPLYLEADFLWAWAFF